MERHEIEGRFNQAHHQQTKIDDAQFALLGALRALLLAMPGVSEIDPEKAKAAAKMTVKSRDEKMLAEIDRLIDESIETARRIQGEGR